MIDELIWHFGGYLHLIVEVGTSNVEYIASFRPDYQNTNPQLNLSNAAQAPAEDDSQGLPVTNFFPDVIPGLAYGGSGFPGGSAARNYDLEAHLRVPEFGDRPDATPVDVPYSFSFSIYLNYQDLASKDNITITTQQNILDDDDALMMEHIDWDPASATIDADATIDSMVELAEGFVPVFLEEVISTDSPEETASNIATVQAERASDGDNGLSHKVGENIGEISETDLETTDDEENEAAPSLAQRIAEDYAPEHTIDLGNNEAVNAAAIVDYSESLSSIVVTGNYYETNAIVQTNVFAFNEGEAGNQAKGLGGGTPENTVINEATVSEQGEYLIQSPTNFYFPEYQFNVDHVHGDVFDMNILKQVNYISDNDRITYEAGGSGYYISLGDNTQVNASQLFKTFSGYDIVVIDGNYHDLNYISQTNIVLDVDEVGVSGEGMKAHKGGNHLENDASIKNVGGGDLFKPLTDDVSDLANSILGQQGELQYFADNIDWGLPYNGTSNLNVLVVSGDYYQINAIEQINIISDADAGLIIFDDEPLPGVTQSVFGDDFELEEKEPELKTSDNTAKNTARIIDYDSQSEFQYLGGDYYEDEILVQINIMVPEEDIVREGDTETLAPEIVAFTGNDAGGSETDNENLEPYQIGGQGTDMLSDILS
ncbi:MAG: hypothetical protein ABJO38_05055 [Stappiaceae bacterium]